MPATTHITLQMLLDEMKRQRRYFKEHYPSLVKKQKLTPWERDHRQAVNEKLIELIEQAIQNKGLDRPKLLQLLTHRP
jgi:hypothetical protein